MKSIYSTKYSTSLLRYMFQGPDLLHFVKHCMYCNLLKLNADYEAQLLSKRQSKIWKHIDLVWLLGALKTTLTQRLRNFSNQIQRKHYSYILI